MDQKQILRNTIERLSGTTGKKHVVAGFDGFVDEIIHVVDKRLTTGEYQRIKKITAFSERIALVAGLSANIELVPVQTKLGGNGPIMANAIIAQGGEVSYIGAIGKDGIHPVFRQFADTCREAVSLTGPGHTDALEFYDGKIMLGKMNNLVEVSMENLLKIKTEKELAHMLSDAGMVAFTNWTMLSNLNGIIEAFGKLIGRLESKPMVFVDLADPGKRTDEDIALVLELIAGMPCETILGMNMNESSIIARVLATEEGDVVERARKIREKTGIGTVVIHPVKGAAIAHADESLWVEGPYASRPKLTTGAGDNFNAGFCTALMGGFSPGESLMAGVCTSGYYVRYAASPTRNELLGFMQQWLQGSPGTPEG